MPLVYQMFPVLGDKRIVEDTMTIIDCFSVNSEVNTEGHLNLLSTGEIIKTLKQ